jgi:hypothetical protein
MENKTKQYIFILIFGLISLPLLQFWIPFKYEDPLKGAVELINKPNFERKTWWSGEFQTKYELWFNQHFGFRNTAVRVHNQLAFSLFNTAKANGVIIGKENYLYELNYINALTGKDFIGTSKIEERSKQLEIVNKLIEEQGKLLIVTFAAGKASYFPSFIPNEYGKPVYKTNYNYYSNILQKSTIHFIDFNKWFLKIKEDSPYPLFSKTGIHWTMYGSLNVTDSLIKYIERKKNIDMPSIIKTGQLISDSLQGSDNDINEGMNLFFPIKTEKLAYPIYHFEPSEGKVKPKLLVIADSYFWSIYDQLKTPSCFSEITFRFYNKEVRNTNGNSWTSSGLEDWKEEINNHDIILLMSTEANLSNFPWGFSDQLLNAYNETEEQKVRRLTILKNENSIKENAAWLASVKHKAEERNISLDSMIRLDAIYLMEMDKMKKQ